MEYVPLPCTIDATCFSSEADRNAACAQIQINITNLFQAMLRMKTRYNDLSITARLPDELLAKIMTYAVSTYEYTQDRTIQVANVCTLWRRVALNCPYLWNRVKYVKSIEWLTEMVIPRSGHLPLHIVLTDEKWPRGLDVILGEIHRIEHLTCYVDQRKAKEVLRNLTRAAPMLKTCAMTTYPVFKLPYYPFANYSPKLTTLSLNNFTLPRGSSFMSGLTEFVYKYAYLPSAGVPLSHLMDLLAAAPQLVTLELRNACSAIDTATTVHVHLPHLQHLIFDDHTIICTSFLSNVIHPPTTYLNICTAQSSRRNNVAIRELAEELGTHIVDVVSLRIEDNHQNTYKVELDYTTESQADHAQVKVRLWEIEQIQAFVETLSLQHLQVLKLRLTSITEAVLNITSNSHCLNTLVFDSSGCVSYVPLLDGISKDEVKSVHRLHKDIFRTQPERFRSSDPASHISKMKNSLAFMLKHASPVPGPLRFPSLRSLSIIGRGYQSNHDLISLAALARLRANRGSPLNKLYFSNYDNRDTEYLTLIRDVVASIYCEG
ncbi:hypothetical protein C0989_002358 [Termitomyces sp. Mn162]|nr:hypothetical protein C0989_002358 [Termitomyces sp. Mn162]